MNLSKSYDKEELVKFSPNLLTSTNITAELTNLNCKKPTCYQIQAKAGLCSNRIHGHIALQRNKADFTLNWQIHIGISFLN
jgi:hypothetical protein